MVAAASYQIAGGAGAAAAARCAIDACCERLPWALKQELRLLVSELVTNCVRHAEADREDVISLTVEVTDPVVRVSVGDQGPGFEPRLAAPGSDAESGFGLYLVDQIASRWGVATEPETRVWFEIECHPGRVRAARRVTTLARDREPRRFSGGEGLPQRQAGSSLNGSSPHGRPPSPAG